MKKVDVIKDAIKGLSTEDKVGLFNAYAADERCLCYMDDFDELTEGIKGSELIAKVLDGNFSLDDEYFHLDAYGNFESFTEDEAVRYIVDWYGNELAEYVADGEGEVPDALADVVTRPA